MAFALFVTLSSLVACNSSEKMPEQSKLSIVTTIYPEYAWTKEILGSHADSVNLTLLMKNGVDLHSYKPTAQDIAKIASADMVVYVGGESDEWIKDALEASPKKDRSEINLMEALGDRVKAEEVVEGMQGETKDERREKTQKRTTNTGNTPKNTTTSIMSMPKSTNITITTMKKKSKTMNTFGSR